MSDPIRELEIANARLTELRTQLATMAELYESQRKILHTVAVERDAGTQRAEAAEQALRLATAAKGASTIVMMTHEAYMDLLAQLAAATKRAEDAESVLATIPMASLLRIVEALLMRGQPLQFDMDAAERWLKTPPARV